MPLETRDSQVLLLTHRLEQTLDPFRRESSFFTLRGKKVWRQKDEWRAALRSCNHQRTHAPTAAIKFTVQKDTAGGEVVNLPYFLHNLIKHFMTALGPHTRNNRTPTKAQSFKARPRRSYDTTERIDFIMKGNANDDIEIGMAAALSKDALHHTVESIDFCL